MIGIRRRIWSALLFSLLAGASTAGAQHRSDSCEDEEYRQFDYWVGEWDVYNPEGRKVGENTITSILDGCALREEWGSEGEHAGTSINFYDRVRRRWHQTWIANNGNPLHLAGGLEDGIMVLESVEEAERQDRISWIAEDEGTVLQVWEVSRDGGKTWDVGFRGRYVRKGGT